MRQLLGTCRQGKRPSERCSKSAPTARYPPGAPDQVVRVVRSHPEGARRHDRTKSAHRPDVWRSRIEQRRSCDRVLPFHADEGSIGRSGMAIGNNLKSSRKGTGPSKSVHTTVLVEPLGFTSVRTLQPPSMEARDHAQRPASRRGRNQSLKRTHVVVKNPVAHPPTVRKRGTAGPRKRHGTCRHFARHHHRFPYRRSSPKSSRAFS